MVEEMTAGRTGKSQSGVMPDKSTLCTFILRPVIADTPKTHRIRAIRTTQASNKNTERPKQRY